MWYDSSFGCYWLSLCGCLCDLFPTSWPTIEASVDRLNLFNTKFPSPNYPHRYSTKTKQHINKIRSEPTAPSSNVLNCIARKKGSDFIARKIFIVNLKYLIWGIVLKIFACFIRLIRWRENFIDTLRNESVLNKFTRGQPQNFLGLCITYRVCFYTCYGRTVW